MNTDSKLSSDERKVREELQKIKERFTALRERMRIQNPILRTLVGVALILVGLLALVTPLTPGAWLALVGLEVLGVHLTCTRCLIAWLHARGWIR